MKGCNVTLDGMEEVPSYEGMQCHTRWDGGGSQLQMDVMSP